MIVGVFGKPGSGKTTYLASICVKARFKRWLKTTLPACLAKFIKIGDIYSTEPMSGTILIDPYDIGTFCPAPYSIFLIHEAGCSFNNRSFKSIPKHCTDFFAQHRHYLCDIYYDSQTVDIDKNSVIVLNVFMLLPKVFSLGIIVYLLVLLIGSV